MDFLPKLNSQRQSMGDKIKTFLLYGTDGLQAQKQAAQQRDQEQLLSEYMERLGAPPEIRAATKFNPAAGLDWMAKAAAPTKLAPGESIVSAGETIAAAPRYIETGDQTIRVGGMPAAPQDPSVRPVRTVDALGQYEDTDTSAPGEQEVEQVFKRDRTYAEDNAAQKALADLERQMQALELRRQALLQAQQRLDLAGRRENRVAATAGKKAAATDGSGASPTLAALETALRKRGLLK